jgi:hypothetical protein
MSDCKRDKYWWEDYPLHKIWCNDLCPLVPRLTYRKGDEYNSNAWGCHWLLLEVWSMENFSFGVDAGLSFNGVYIGAILPYLRIVIGIRHMYYSWCYKIENLLRRKPAIKRESE